MRWFPNRFSLLVAILATLSLAACGDEGSPESTDIPVEDPHHVIVLDDDESVQDSGVDNGVGMEEACLQVDEGFPVPPGCDELDPIEEPMAEVTDLSCAALGLELHQEYTDQDWHCAGVAKSNPGRWVTFTDVVNEFGGKSCMLTFEKAVLEPTPVSDIDYIDFDVVDQWFPRATFVHDTDVTCIPSALIEDWVSIHGTGFPSTAN